MRLIAATSAKAKAESRFRNLAMSEGHEYGWDAVLLLVSEAMAATKPHDQPERIILTYARGVGWSQVLRDIASLMEADGCAFNVFATVETSDVVEVLETGYAAPSAPQEDQ